MRITENTVVTLEVKVYDADTNELLEDTKEVGPFVYIQGMGQYVPAIEIELDGKEKGYSTTITLQPINAYGEYDPEDFEVLSKSDFEEFDDIYEGMEFITEFEDGAELQSKITKIEGDEITVDYNHPFAGKNLRFEIEVCDVREATSKEIEQGYAYIPEY